MALDALRDLDEDVRRLASNVIGELSSADAWVPLLLDTRLPRIQCRPLSWHAHSASLASGPSNPSGQQRETADNQPRLIAAIRGLGATGEPSACDAIAPMLSATSRAVRRAAAAALADIARVVPHDARQTALLIPGFADWNLKLTAW